ncbi:MAG: response regulator [Deltaproteobacteria bacterium]|nr:response regulator [Nannocystaceae bacterium]
MASARILVADDEPLITSLVARALAPEHEVVCVADGDEVLRMLAEDPGFDIVMLDLSMRRIGGIAVYDELAIRAPELAERVMFLTGGAITEDDQDFLARSVRPRLDKPFSLVELRIAVARLLAS